MSDPTPQPPVSRAELARDIGILLVLHVGCYWLVFRGGIRGWAMVEEAPLYALMTGGVTLIAGILAMLALGFGKRRWTLAVPAYCLLMTALFAAWKYQPDDVDWGGPREGLLLASLTQLWLAFLALAIAAGACKTGSSIGNVS